MDSKGKYRRYCLVVNMDHPSDADVTMTCQGSMPFIVSTYVKNTEDPKTRKLIRRHVMLGKNVGKTYRYKRGTLSAPQVDADTLGQPKPQFEQLDSLIKILHDSGLRRTVSSLPRGQLADVVGTQILQDIIDCEYTLLLSLYWALIK
jgi:hypothetical protein